MGPNTTAIAPKLDAGRRITRIVLPTIKGTHYDRTTTLGVRMALAWESQIDFVHVTPSIASADPELTRLADQVRATHPELDIRATHLHGDDPATALADHAGPGTLVVMDTEHMDAWRIKDSVADRLLDRVGGPVMLLGSSVPVSRLRERGIDGEIVLGVDGTPAAEAGIGPALALAMSVRQRLWLARVVPEPEPADGFHPEIAGRLQALAERCSAEIATRWEVVQANDPAKALEAFAARRDAAVLVVSRRRRTSPARPTMASITAGLVAVAARPVLVLPAPEIPAVDAG